MGGFLSGVNYKLSWFFHLGLSAIILASCLAYVNNSHAEENIAGTIEGTALPFEEVRKRVELQHEAYEKLYPFKPVKGEILFGDLHVHTTFSGDAVLRTMPSMNQRLSAFPIAGACDYARYCSAVDFWSINDHAEFITPERWAATLQSVRQCQDLAGDGTPDLISFLGWEWTQVGSVPDKHYGHKNVVLYDLYGTTVPLRSIASNYSDSPLDSTVKAKLPGLSYFAKLPLLDPLNAMDYFRVFSSFTALVGVPPCELGKSVHELPLNCLEGAPTPQDLYARLRQWGGPTFVIPHGTTWGFYTPPGTTFDKQIASHDPELERLFEVWSGHGNAEEYRSWRAVTGDTEENLQCPVPTSEYKPCCWRAGEIIASRCDNPNSAACQEKVERARINYLKAGVAGHATVSGTTGVDWQDCGQCRDCFLPAFSHRPGNSLQYILAKGNFTAPGQRYFRPGIIAASDIHSARPGTGYKEFNRSQNTETMGGRSPLMNWAIGMSNEGKPLKESIDPEKLTLDNIFMDYFEAERQMSYFMTGGLTAVHSEGRDRKSLWQALYDRHVYGTSGPRILLWFNANTAMDNNVSMGGELEVKEGQQASFEVAAVGSLVQKPGCPDFANQSLGKERLAFLCQNECYHPSNKRMLIDRIEVIRILPQVNAEESVDELIQDPWYVHECPPDTNGCRFRFTDEEPPPAGREVLYYVRAIQEASLAVNGGALRCSEFDEEGHCVKTNLCYGDYRTDYRDDCLSPVEERAWSTPILLKYR